MREIKFRAWDKKLNIMLKVDYLEFSQWWVQCERPDDAPKHNGDAFYSERNSFKNEGTDRHILMQYTGLKDKNEKEIYEGDIIEGGYLNSLTQEFTSKKYIVEFKKASFTGKLIGHSPFGDTWLNFIKGKIIGNIYENPELLEV